jgi:transposase
MPGRMRITLSAEQRAALVTMRDRESRRPYLRERAAAILKVADGASCNHVARHGLLRRRDCDTITQWCHRYLDEGISGLVIRPGRGRKPAFSPSLQQQRSGASGPARGSRL